jgi:predicted PurR-regulated permease PerM
MTNISKKWSMALSFIITFIIIGAIFWLIGARIQQQVAELAEKLPEMIDQAKSKLQQYPWGDRVLNQFSGDNAQKYLSSAQKFFGSTFGALGDIYVILFLSIFITAEPGIYQKGIIALVPPKNRERGKELMQLVGQKLQSWLKGKLFAMAVVGVLTGIGLAIIGVPMALALAFIAAIFNFIPNFGPIIALIPAFLIGLTQDMTTALLIAGLYIVIQVVESNFITPMVQRKLVKIPPALIITGQLMIGAVTGYLGIILATPVVLIIMVLVQELYVKPSS